MASISLEGVRKVYPNGYEAIKGLDLHIDDGEFMVVVGPSGCGKTTVLRMIAGLEAVSSGTVQIGDEIVNDVPPRERDIAMVFQSYALYPNMNVAQNIGFALRMKKYSKAEIKQRVDAAAKILGITEWLNQKPSQLSGGQRQRVAMGRAIVREPSAFLMDEPLSNLDAKLRVQMRAEVARVQKRIGVATLYVTHDQTEAMTLGHRVAVLRAGVLQQCDTPQVLYDRPANIFVAGFIGSPAMNLLMGRLSSEADTVLVGSQSLALGNGALSSRPGLKRFGGRAVVVGIRPEDLTIGDGDPSKQKIVGEVELVEALGSELLVHFRTDGQIVNADALEDAKSEPGTIVDEIGEDAPDVDECIARIEPHSIVRSGDRVTFEFSTDRLEFFDADTGVAIWD
ncbi:MAG: sn-glycerol-3-phosphate ABC transporter ATP-binding protein UgpC [Acidimicrobiales bacterium]